MSLSFHPAHHTRYKRYNVHGYRNTVFHTVWLSIAIFDSVYNIRSNSCLEKIVEKKLQKNLVDSQKVFTFAPSN